MQLGGLARVGSVVACLIVTACGGGQETPQTPTDDGAAEQGHRSGPSMGMDADIGALDEGKVTSVFQKQSSKIASCFEKGARRLPYLAGEIRFQVRVDLSGKAKSVHALDSSLGDHDTEECMMHALESTTWPAPEGGREGIAESPFTFDAGGAARPPVDLDASALGKDADKLHDVVSGCRSSSGAGKLKATIYVEADGTVKASGVSGPDAASRQAGRCVADGVKALKLASPGSYAGKIVVED